MEVNVALVEKLAKLSRLHFSDEEKKEIGQDLEKMIEFVNKLNELDLTGVPPTLHMGREINNLRSDVVKGSVTTEEALSNAPGRKENFFTVPKVIKKQA